MKKHALNNLLLYFPCDFPWVKVTWDNNPNTVAHRLRNPSILSTRLRLRGGYFLFSRCSLREIYHPKKLYVSLNRCTIISNFVSHNHEIWLLDIGVWHCYDAVPLVWYPLELDWFAGRQIVVWSFGAGREMVAGSSERALSVTRGSLPSRYIYSIVVCGRMMGPAQLNYPLQILKQADNTLHIYNYI